MFLIAGGRVKQTCLVFRKLQLRSVNLIKLSLSRGWKRWFYSLEIDETTYYLRQDEGWFLDNDFDSCDLLVSRVLDIRKARLMLQSGHKSGNLDFIFELFMECVKFIFYLYFFLYSTWQCHKKPDYKMDSCLFLLRLTDDMTKQ